MAKDSGKGAAFVTGGVAAGAVTSAAVGGAGLAGGFGAVGIGTAPVMGAGAVVGAAVYGTVKAIGDSDAFALGSATFGAATGVGVSSVIGGMGFVAPKIGLAVGIGTVPLAGVGAVVGLAAYGMAKMLEEAGTEETPSQVFEQMEATVLWQEAYAQTLLELDPELAELAWKQKFAAIEIEEELQALKAELHTKTDLKLNPAPSKFSNPTPKSSVTVRYYALPLESQAVAADNDKIEVVSLTVQQPQSWRCIKTLKGHIGAVNSLAISADGQILASGSDDRTVSLWNLRTGKWINTFYGQAEAVLSVSISSDGKTVASGSVDRKITSWQLDTKKLLYTYLYLDSFYSHNGFVHSVAFSPDGKTVASGSADKTIRLWGRYTGKVTRTLNGHSDAVLAVAISPDGQTLVSGSADQTIRVWDLSSWKQPYILTGHSGYVNSVAISSDGNTIASGSADSKINLWNLHTGELLNTFAEHSAAVCCVTFSPDGQTLASCSIDGTIKLLNLSTGELSTLRGRGCVAFSSDGKTLVSGGKGGDIRIWGQIPGLDNSTLDSMAAGEWWEVLKVDQTADRDDVKRAYYRLVHLYHPDVNRCPSAEAKMQAISQAYKEFQQLGARSHVTQLS